jgi:transposase
MQKFLNAVFYVLRSGCQWRLLPRDFHPWSTIHHYTSLKLATIDSRFRVV